MTPSRPVALVTGGAVRLGRAIVVELTRGGWDVVFTYRSSERAAGRLAAELGAAGGRTVALSADLDDRGAAGVIAARVRGSFGRLDALVNSAAVFPRTPFAELTRDDFAAVLRTNLEAPIFLAQACAPLLRERRGAVVNIADIHGVLPLPGHLAYSVSKAGLIAATRALAIELAPEVRVNAIAPGIAMFPEGYDDATRKRLLARTLLGREGGGPEIARAVRYLIEGTTTTTGQVLTIDGGRTIAP